ncbi:universal stress protein [Aneurinibacillus sp. BA2021]|nr:universal stress protein [Aneurinibacillus sp. BA2021]
MKTILVPVDGSQHALRALGEAADMAKAFGGSILLLNVQYDLETFHTRRFFSREQIEQYEKELSDEVLAPAVDELRKHEVAFTVKVRVGSPKKEIIAEAVECGADYIVMGSRGMGSVMGSVLGSVSYGVLNEAPCPVLIVPNRKEK